MYLFIHFTLEYRQYIHTIPDEKMAPTKEEIIVPNRNVPHNTRLEAVINFIYSMGIFEKKNLIRRDQRAEKKYQKVNCLFFLYFFLKKNNVFDPFFPPLLFKKLNYNANRECWFWGCLDEAEFTINQDVTCVRRLCKNHNTCHLCLQLLDPKAIYIMASYKDLFCIKCFKKIWQEYKEIKIMPLLDEHNYNKCPVWERAGCQHYDSAFQSNAYG